MAAHVWNLLVLKESLWVKWIHIYKIKDRNFWDIPCRGNMTWGWRKILNLRPTLRQFIWHKVGDGRNISIWFDNWCNNSPLCNLISNRDILRSGLLLTSKVADLFHNGNLVWPTFLSSIHSDLHLITNASYVSNYDQIVWTNREGDIKPFSVHEVWNAIRPRSSNVVWFNSVWFPHCIPRHAFNLWLIINRKLKTQDKLSNWSVSGSLSSNCSLCDVQPDSHDHLFFKCRFSNNVWNKVKGFADCQHLSSSFDSIIAYIIPISTKRSSRSVIIKLVVAASAYYIWQERNFRLFQKGKRSEDQLVACIFNTVRLKLVSAHFKKSADALKFLKIWKISDPHMF